MEMYDGVLSGHFHGHDSCQDLRNKSSCLFVLRSPQPFNYSKILSNSVMTI